MKDGAELEKQCETVLGIEDVRAMKETQKAEATKKGKISLLPR